MGRTAIFQTQVFTLDGSQSGHAYYLSLRSGDAIHHVRSEKKNYFASSLFTICVIFFPWLKP